MGKAQGFLLLTVFVLALTGTLAATTESHLDDRFMELQSDDFDLQGPITCPLHHVGTRYEEVPVFDGFYCSPDEEYKRAKLLRFPYSYFELRSCSCEARYPPLPRLVCPICRRNELRWRIAHFWSIRRDH